MALRFRMMPIVTVILIALCTLMAWQSYLLFQDYQYNQALQSKVLSGKNNPDDMMLDAWKLTQQKEYQKASQLYTKVAASKKRELHADANYNAANLYQKQALSLLEEKGLGAWDEVTPLLSMAKEHYRSALRYRPDWLEAKYNFEMALRFAPSIESSVQKPVKEEEPEEGLAVDGWPSIPGFPRGMP
jgi:mxaK protein